MNNYRLMIFLFLKMEFYDDYNVKEWLCGVSIGDVIIDVLFCFWIYVY